MNNYPDLYFDFVGATGEHSINDYIDYTSNINYSYTSNTSNILSNQIIITSNIIENDISITSNILDNKTSNLRYDINKLIKEETEHIPLPIPYDKKHTYIYNSNVVGEIRFWCKSTTDFPIINPLGVPDYRTKIDVDGKLKIYYTYDPLISLTFGNGWIDIANSIVNLNSADANFVITITGLQAEINNNYNLLQQQIFSLIFALEDYTLMTQSQRIQVMDAVKNQAELVKIGQQSMPLALSSIREATFTGIGGYLTNGLNIATAIIANNPITASFLGATGAVFYFIANKIYEQEYNNRTLGLMYSNVSNMVGITENTRNELYSNIGDERIRSLINITSNEYNINLIQGFLNSNTITQQYLNAININELKLNQTNISNIFVSSNVLSNINLNQGFINSNITNQQYINSINTNEIKMNNLNFSNIFVSSNVLNTTSDTLSNLTLNSSNNNFNYTFNSSNILSNLTLNSFNDNFNYTSNSSNINFNYTSNLNFVSSNNLINNYSKNIRLILPNTNFIFDATNNIFKYDLDISKYVPFKLIQQSATLFIKTRIFRITTFLSTDFNLLQNTNLNNLTGNPICYPETLLIYMSNDKNISGIHTADDNICNGLIYGKQNPNIYAGYWNIVPTNFNYLRFITGIGFDMNIIIEPILF